MTAILKVDEIQDTSGNNIINENANTVTIGKSGDTVNVIGTLQNGGTNFLQGITEADQWRLTADITSDGTDQFITSNLERIDTSGQGTLGTGMTESSGVFTFPSTGIWIVRSVMSFQGIDGTEVAMTNSIYVTVNNSTYSRIALNQNGNNSGSQQNMSAMAETFIDVTNTSNVKVKFEYSSVNNGNRILGSTTQNRTCFIFIRLGDT
jgi:hypothetical protein